MAHIFIEGVTDNLFLLMGPMNILLCSDVNIRYPYFVVFHQHAPAMAPMNAIRLATLH